MGTVRMLFTGIKVNTKWTRNKSITNQNQVVKEKKERSIKIREPEFKYCLEWGGNRFCLNNTDINIISIVEEENETIGLPNLKNYQTAKNIHNRANMEHKMEDEQ